MLEILISQWQKLRFALVAVAAMWVILALSSVFNLRQYGIHPRSWDGLTGIFTAPFLHADYQHLAANTPMILLLGWLIQNIEPRRFAMTLLGITFLAGFGTWLIAGAQENHIGASGIIYGLLGYCMAVGFFSRKPVMIVISITMAALYGGAITGVLPQTGRVSWEGHLCGFLAGVGMAKILNAHEPQGQQEHHHG